MEIQHIKTKQHFYYCIFIALLVEMKSGKIKNNKQKKRFLLGWINRAKSYNLFSKEVDNEIAWLKHQLIFRQAVEHIESILNNIYESAFLIGLEASQERKEYLSRN